MKLQDQVCTEQQAKRLHELGVAQQGYYCYAHRVINSKPAFNGEMTEWEAEYSDVAEPVETGVAIWDGLPYACAFTVAELSIMLPASIQFAKKWATLRIIKADACEEYNQPDSYIAGYYTSEKELVKDWVMGNGHDNLANAAAGLLIMLIEHGKTKVDEINARLCADK